MGNMIAAGGLATGTDAGTINSAVTSAMTEAENNGFWLPFMAAVWLIDKGITLYQAKQDLDAIANGEKSVTDVIRERGDEYIAAVLLGNAARYGLKFAKIGGKWVVHKIDDVKPSKPSQNVAHSTGGGKPGQTHHICTDKNCVSTHSGGPWTPRFQEMFDGASMSLQDEANKVLVYGHKGPHPKEYHQEIFRRLDEAIRVHEKNTPAYERALRGELARIKSEIQTPGSNLNLLVTKGK